VTIIARVKVKLPEERLKTENVESQKVAPPFCASKGEAPVTAIYLEPATTL